MALKAMPVNSQVIKYGFSIGHATEDIQPGQWVHSHNMKTNLSGQEEYTYEPENCVLPSLESKTFQGYLRKDGKAAVRNEIWIIPTVGCVNDVAKALASSNQDLVKGSIDGLYAFTHPFGCSQTGADHAQTRKLLASLAKHPNAGAVAGPFLVVELCEEDFTSLSKEHREKYTKIFEFPEKFFRIGEEIYALPIKMPEHT